MISTHFTRLAQALVLAAFLAALTAPGAFAGSSSDTPIPDVIDRWVAAHATDARSERPIPDVIERWVAAHPVVDARSPDTRLAPGNTQVQVVDRRSPDTLARLSRRPVVLAASDDFEWGNVGVAVGLASVILALLAGSMLLWSRRHARERARTT
jgi:hypothetical protein